MPNIVFIGGTGASIIGKEAKNIPGWNVCLLVSLVDDGGSTGRLRQELNIPPVGDIRKALTSLSGLPESAINAFEYRFEAGNLEGHVMGNIFLAGLISECQDINKAIEMAENMLAVKGKVLTTTLDKTTLKTTFLTNDNVKNYINGEHNLDENKDTRLGDPVEYKLNPDAPFNPKAVECLLEADLVVLGPGDLGANTMAPILTKEITEALQNTKAKLVYIASLMTKKGETGNLLVEDCLRFIEDQLKRKIDYLLLNDAPIPQEIIDLYKEQGEDPMAYNRKILESDKDRKIIPADIIALDIYQKSKADTLRRSMLRHDGKKVVKALKGLLK